VRAVPPSIWRPAHQAWKRCCLSALFASGSGPKGRRFLLLFFKKEGLPLSEFILRDRIISQVKSAHTTNNRDSIRKTLRVESQEESTSFLKKRSKKLLLIKPVAC